MFTYIDLQMQQAMKSIEHRTVQLCSQTTQYFEPLYKASWEYTAKINSSDYIEDATSVANSLSQSLIPPSLQKQHHTIQNILPVHIYFEFFSQCHSTSW
jgi:hypothetical protein